MFALKGAMPEKYKDRQELSGPGGGPIEIDHKVDDTLYMTRKEILTEIAAEINKMLAEEIDQGQGIIDVDIDPESESLRLGEESN